MQKTRFKSRTKNGENVSAHKVLTQVHLGTIFSDIIRNNPTIKGKVFGRVFCYNISALYCVRRFTDSQLLQADYTHSIVCCRQNVVSCTASLRLTRSIAHERRRLQRRQGDGVRLLGNQRHQSPSRWAHAHGRVCMLCHTGSARRSSAPSVR